MATDLAEDEWGQYHFLNYHSAEQFVQKGVGFGVIAGSRIAAACTSALVCSTGIEMNIITLPAFRKKGLATLVAAKLIVYCLENGLVPHWDAANEVSKQLAGKLGYREEGEYGIVVCK
jgi:predicted GNAT family acetyltransferase